MGRNKAADHYQAMVGKEFGNFGGSPYVLKAVGIRKTQVFVDSLAHFVAIEHFCKISLAVNFLFESQRHGCFSRTGKSGKPDDPGILPDQKSFPVTPYVRVKVGEYTHFHLCRDKKGIKGRKKSCHRGFTARVLQSGAAKIKDMKYFALALCMLPLAACKPGEKSTTASGEQNKPKAGIHQSLPPVIIYKTTSDYFRNVPVILSDDKTMILSYPDVTDVYYHGELAYPSLLAGGYLLDNRGIGPGAAFLKISYEEYSRLNASPSPEWLMTMILDARPFSEMYICHCSRDTAEINRWIRNGDWSRCTKTK